ncbi:MAG: pyridoxal-phosphate dependent enzyme [Erysipelotrichales bacterium]
MKEFQRVEVGYINTPIEKLENLTKYLDKGDIYIKRDDMTGLALGGNKTRKLDYIVKYALDNGYTRLLTYGAAQTNHGRLTIAAAAKFNLDATLVIEGIKGKEAEGNLILDCMMGADILYIEKDKEKNVKEYIAQLEAQGEKVFEVVMGGSSAIGAYGYFKCIEEIINQTNEEDINIDYLISGYGSTGTFAGLWLGAKYFNAPFEIIGIPVFPTPFSLVDCANLINELASMLEIDIRCDASQLDIRGGLTNNKYAGPSYGKSNEEIREAMYLLAQKEAIISDPVYTGKVVYGMIDLVSNELIDKNKNVMLLHTGGAPSLFTAGHGKTISDDLWEKKTIQK